MAGVAVGDAVVPCPVANHEHQRAHSGIQLAEDIEEFTALQGDATDQIREKMLNPSTK